MISPARRVSASTSEKIVKRPWARASSRARLASTPLIPRVERSFIASSASSPRPASIALRIVFAKPSFRSSRFATSASTMRRISGSASFTSPVCFLANSATSTASHTMWFAQTAWNQNDWIPTERLPTSEFQAKKPGANASPSTSTQPVESILKQKRSCSPR